MPPHGRWLLRQKVASYGIPAVSELLADKYGPSKAAYKYINKCQRLGLAHLFIAWLLNENIAAGRNAELVRHALR